MASLQTQVKVSCPSINELVPWTTWLNSFVGVHQDPWGNTIAISVETSGMDVTCIMDYQTEVFSSPD